MKKIYLLLITLILLVSIQSLHAQKDGKENGTIFYNEVEVTENKDFKVTIDIFDTKYVQFIELEMLDEKKAKLLSNMAHLRIRENKFYLTYNNVETKVIPENIVLVLKNTIGEIPYPAIKVKLLDKNFRVIDYSEKVFY